MTARGDIQCTKSTWMFMSHRQTEYHREGPRGTLVHDEHHVFWALNHFDRHNMTYTFSSNKWTFAHWTKHKNKHKLAYTLLLPLRLNCSSFDQQLRVMSRSKHCRNLDNHHDESPTPSDVHNLKSFITLHVFSRIYTCHHSKFS